MTYQEAIETALRLKNALNEVANLVNQQIATARRAHELALAC